MGYYEDTKPLGSKSFKKKQDALDYAKDEVDNAIQ